MSHPGFFGAVRRGIYPHQLARLLDNRLRRLLIRPETFADRLPIHPDSQVLEVGPGSGYFSRELARRLPQGRLELFDLQPEMLAKAVASFGDPPPQLGWTAGDAGADWPFADASFDIVTMALVLGEIGPVARPLRAAFRVLRPGGMLAVHEHPPDPDYRSLRRRRAQIEAAGFRFTRSWGRWNYTALFQRPVACGGG